MPNLFLYFLGARKQVSKQASRILCLMCPKVDKLTGDRNILYTRYHFQHVYIIVIHLFSVGKNMCVFLDTGNEVIRSERYVHKLKSMGVNR
jgi:hypothetical protein